MNNTVERTSRVGRLIYCGLFIATTLCACGGSSLASLDPLTAPGIDTVPQQNFLGPSGLDTLKRNAIQDNYLNNLGAIK